MQALLTHKCVSIPIISQFHGMTYAHIRTSKTTLNNNNVQPPDRMIKQLLKSKRPSGMKQQDPNVTIKMTVSLFSLLAPASLCQSSA